MEVAVYQSLQEKKDIDKNSAISPYPHIEANGSTKKTECSLLNCSRCLADYSDEQVPRSLRCGHSMCTPCSEQCLSDQRVCPECQEKLLVKNVSDLPVNYPLLRLIRSLVDEKVYISDVKLPTLTVDVFCSEDVWMCSAHSNPIMFLCCSCNTWVCQDCLVIDHPILPRGSCRVLSFTNAMEKVRNMHKDTANQILKDIEDVKKSFENDIAIHDSRLKYCPCDIKSHEYLVQQIENQLEEDKKTYAFFVEKTKIRLRMSTENVSSPHELATSCKELCNYQKELTIDIPFVNEKKEPGLKIMLQHFRWDLKLLVQGMKPVYAMTEEGGDGRRWASVTIKENRLLLYSLNKGNPPKEGIIIPFAYVRKLIPQHSTVIFFEVGTAQDEFGRMYLKLLCGDNRLNRQMKLMCSGENGVSYKGTCFYGLDEKEGLLKGGDYENNDGTGGTAIVKNIGKVYISSIYQKVTGALIASKKSTRFHFHLHNVNNYIYQAIGRMVAGEKVLKSLSKIQPITKTLIRDCGLFIPMKNKDDL